MKTRWIGDSKNGIEIRNEDEYGADEILLWVDGMCVLHIEAMCDELYWMSLSAGDHEAHVHIGSRSLRAKVDAKVEQIK